MVTISPGWALALLTGVLILGVSMALFLIRKKEPLAKLFALPMLAVAMFLIYVGASGCILSAIVSGPHTSPL